MQLTLTRLHRWLLPAVPPLLGVASVALLAPEAAADDASRAYGLQDAPVECAAARVSHPVWSPDGARIAFLSNASGSYEIYLLDVESRVVSRLTDNDSFEGSVSWAPTSDKFAFWSALEGDSDFEGYRYDLATGELTSLVRHPGNDFDLDWSPEGTRVLFQSERDGNRELYVLELLGGETRRLTSNDAEDLTPDWSPDGTRFAFSSNRSGMRQIHVMALGSETAVALGPQPDGANYFPVWDPAGRRLLVTTRHANDYSLHLVNPRAASTELLARPVSSGPASWSPDGRIVVYSEMRGDSSVIRLLDLEAGERRDLIDCATVATALRR